MILKAYSLLDAKVGTFGTPFFMAHVQQAIRACADLAMDMNTVVGRHPADFILCEVGTFDDVSGVLASQAPVQIAVVVNLVPRGQESFVFERPQPDGQAEEHVA